MDKDGTIKLLMESLKFYAESANYFNDQINKDQGYQARFILDLINKNEESILSYEKQFEQSLINYEKELGENITEEGVAYIKIVNNLIEKQNGG